MTDPREDLSDERIEALWQVDFGWNSKHVLAFARAILSEGTASLRDDRDSWRDQASARAADAVKFAEERDALKAENERLRGQVGGMRSALEKGAESVLVKAAGDAVRRAEKARDEARVEADALRTQIAEAQKEIASIADPCSICTGDEYKRRARRALAALTPKESQ